MADHDELISQFCAFTSADPTTARTALEQTEWNLEAAVGMYFAANEPEQGEAGEPEDTMEDEPMAAAPAAATGGGRTLNGAPAPASASTASSSQRASSSRQPQRTGPRTIKDLQGGSSHGGHGHAHGDDDDDDDEKDQDFFAGGEKSGLAVQNPSNANPRDHINRILERARQNAPRPGGDDEEQPQSRFRGAGMTLGGDDTPSQLVPDPEANRPRPPPRVRRVLHLWRDGFSVDDGRLFRYDDPANAGTLEMINQGRAPLSILEVEHGQEVDLEVNPHKDEDYVQPKMKYKPFSGSGQRLGSPTPGVATSSSATPAQAPAAAAAPASSSAGAQAANQVDDSQPTITLQVRLGDGTRLQSRFNTTQTVGDVYAFVNAASPASLQRSFALMTTFPSKELSDKSVVLGDMSDFKRGGVVVQKWT